MGGLNGLAEEGSVHFKPTSKFQSKLAAKINPPSPEECQFFVCLLLCFDFIIDLSSYKFEGGLSWTYKARNKYGEMQ